MASKSEFADAYKLKPDVLEKRNARLQRRSIEWKNLRYEEVGKRRKIDLENLSPLQEQDQNISNISKSYPDKTPVKIPKDNQENKLSKRETISQRTQRLLQWKQEKEKKKAAEKAKKKPSFKVTGVQHKDIDVFSKDNKVAKAKVTHNTTVNRPTRVKKEIVPKPPPVPVPVQKPATRSQPTRTTANPKQSAVQSKPSAAKPQQTIRVTRQTRSAAKLKGSPKSATRTAPKTQKTTKSNLSAAEKKPSPEYDVSLHKVSTLRGASFAPTDFTFEAPDSLKSFAFQPLSPASAASFLDPNRDLTSTSFFSHDPSVGRCSTPKSQDENSMDQSEHAVDETLEAGQDNTTVEAMTTPKRQTRTRSGHSTATSSESESDTVSNVTAVKVASGRKSRKPVKSSDSDASHSSASSGNTSKSSRSRSRQKDTTVVELSENKDGEVECDSKKIHSDKQDSTTSANISKSSRRKSVRQETESAVSKVASPAKVTKVETVTEATTPQKDHRTEDVPEKEVPETAETKVVKTPKTPRRLSVRQQNAISENESETVSEAITPIKETTEDVSEGKVMETVETKLIKTPKTPRRRSVQQQNESETVSKATTPKKGTTDDVAGSKETEPVETKVVKTSKTPRRRSVRQQNANSESESEKTEKEEKQAKTPRRRSVRGRRKSESEDEAVVAENAKTPKRSLRKSSNTSVLESCEPVAAMEVIEEEQETDDVFQAETKKEQSNPSEEKTVEDAKTDVNENCTPARSRRCSTSDACFRQPGLPMSAQRSGRKRRRTESSAEDCGAARSPEEWVKILSTSPMVEMRRRTPKAPRLSAEPISQSLNFDDITDEPMDLEVSGGKDKTASETAEKTDIEVVAEKASSSSKPEPTAAEVSETKTEGEHDIPYFRNLLITETARLNVFSEDWTKISQTGGMSEEVEGEIRTTVGQAQLLIAQRFKQFTGLVDNCEFGTGEKETTCTDLQGFWDMIYFQVEDVDKKFAQLSDLQKNNWKREEKQPEKKVLKKKAAVTVKPKVKGGPSKFAAFRAQMKKQKEEAAAEAATGQEEPVKVFDAGFFKVSSPVKSPAPHCEGGTPSKQNPNTDSGSSETKTEPLVLPQEVDVPKTLLMKTPKRKSYVPSVPSPLLRDITPKQKPRKSLSSAPTSATKKESDTSPLSIFTPPQQNSPQPVSLFTPPTGNTPKDQTPKRRSIRLRKSLTLTPTVEEQQELALKTEEGGLDARFFQPSEGMETDEHNASTDLAKFLAPTTPAQSTEELDSSFSKFLQPTEERLPTGGKKSALKKLPSSQRLRSRRSVQFAPSLNKSPESHSRLPSTPYSRDSTIPKPRVSHGECYLFTPPSEDDGDQISSAEGSSPVLKSRPRPSLLFTPAKPESSSGTETDNLMVFTPSPK